MSNNTNAQHGGAYQNSSGGCSSASSSVDLKCQSSQKRQQQQNQHEQQPNSGAAGRSRSFLHCLGKHLGRHFPQHQVYQLRTERGRISHMLAIYNSEEDLHSSSTDSFSLSYERYAATQATQHHINDSGVGVGIGGGGCGGSGSSVDLTGEERSSGTSSAASAYSRLSSNTGAVFNAEMEDVWPKRHERHHYYLDASNNEDDADDDVYSDNSQGDDRDADNDNDSDDDNNHVTTNKTTTTTMTKQQRSSSNCNSNRNSNHNTNIADKVIRVAPKKKSTTATITAMRETAATTAIKSKSQKYGNNTATPPSSRSRSTSPCSITKGLHLSRISIASSVCRMFQHFSINSSPSTATSTRSLSCSSTPLRGASTNIKNDNKNNNNNNINNNNRSRNTKKSKTNTATTKTKTTASQARSTSFSIISANSINSNANSNSKKKEKKQQSILRPPVSYVYMKGMSGLYSRVPRYTVCCPYQAA